MSEEMNFEMAEVKTFTEGEVVTGTITKVEDKVAFVSVGYKVDGMIPISELSSLHIEKANEAVSVGEELQLKVIKVTDEEIVLSKRAVQEVKAWEDLQQRFEKGEVFEAQVADVVKGGLVVDVGIRGFVPASLVERHFVEDFSDYKGKTLRLKVAEIDKDNNKLILSQRAVLDEEVESQKKLAVERLKPGQIVEGTVQRLTNFGAFVDIGGVDGLVHISQIAHQRVETPSELLNEGDKVKVKILSIDLDNGRISLSIKDTLPGPWQELAEKIKAGDVIEGEVKRLVSFGAFVEIVPGIEGLVHISQIANRHIATPSEALKEGDVVKAKVLDVNVAEKRISLSIRDLLEAEERADIPTEQYERDEESGGFSLGDVIGEQLKKFK
ncbi:30S ribosomal protein S1 [Anaerobacillus isosaccharinicus]|uniref:30S ribosomal protein S1 n=1 Tax=Anaerobacillus isosaccharinicus TaxID=1532552 RepID=A0A1S2KW20_9BACI|nr:30S ribosomal protein S1 [Anaerobacillus isosaccharinicus]MBA5585836.1 30S ribosomal protein S1 [Anaerobacillus isosaccharinicus]QOY35869.1 30S ribosomal protein S1 [Anaerobacillus isosaccharinicus]